MTTCMSLANPTILWTRLFDKRVSPAGFLAWARDKNLGHVVASREFDERHGVILALEDTSFDVQVTRKIQVPLDRIALSLLKRAEVPGRLNGHRKALRIQKIADPLGPADQSRCFGRIRHQHQDLVMDRRRGTGLLVGCLGPG